MDASRIFSLVFVLGVLLTLARAVTTEADLASSTSTEDMESTTTTTTTARPPPRNCATARGVAGVCAARQECDHSTGPVDHSLYAPSWYKR
ncbi:hypothetical protein ABMA27_012641 [Loxostege sticticalis]|uniref:Uncharacterized protein n=1 Tax=Loxostege sticticalis TaxID=481309 RepID=A0ABR3GZB6_LOXSC